MPLLGGFGRFYSSLSVVKSSVKDALTCSHLVGKQISVNVSICLLVLVVERVGVVNPV